MRFKAVPAGAAALWLAAAGCAAEAQEAPSVVATIQPIHSLVAGVMRGVEAPHLLIRGGASPHTYVMRPSDARALQEADLVFWVGDDMETFLTGPLNGLGELRAVALAQADGVTLLPVREGGIWAAHDHGDAHAHEDEQAHGDEHRHAEEHGHAEHAHAEHADEGAHAHGDDHAHGDEPGDDHAHGARDMHIWLDPDNAAAMVDAVADALAEEDPTRAETYRANAQALGERIAALDAALAEALAPVQDRPFIVFHDAYRYFEEHYGLTPAGSVTVSPDVRPGAARMAELRVHVEARGALCVFAEPQFAPSLVETIVEGTGARAGVLDPLGADLEAGPDQYFALMRGLAESLRDCLSGEG